MRILKILILFVLSLIIANCSQSKKENRNSKTEKEIAEMIRPEALSENQHMYVIEREIPGAGKLTAEELKGISQISCDVLEKMGSEIKWLHSYVTGDKIYCVYTAPNEEMVREHARQGGFQANSVSEVNTIIDPSTAE